ncbi:hypothetical protein ABZ746_13620 [Streptomyces sp. NPDC020096]
MVGFCNASTFKRRLKVALDAGAKGADLADSVERVKVAQLRGIITIGIAINASAREISVLDV